MMSINKRVKKNSFKGELKKMGQKVLLSIADYSSHFMNPQGKQCRLIQKRYLCFCGHRFDSHVYHESGSLHCASLGCSCKSFEYIPDVSIKCLCKHTNLDHDKQNKRCQKCSNCVGFATDLYCRCGYRFMQHNNHLTLKNNKENQKKIGLKNSSSLPLISKNSYDYLPKGKDHVLEKLSKSMLQSKIIQKEAINYEHKLQDEENSRQEYLKEKLRQANKRYFAKFTYEEQKQSEKMRQPSAYDLFMQPHMYRNISLTKFIKQTLHH